MGGRSLLTRAIYARSVPEHSAGTCLCNMHHPSDRQQPTLLQTANIKCNTHTKCNLPRQSVGTYRHKTKFHLFCRISFPPWTVVTASDKWGYMGRLPFCAATSWWSVWTDHSHAVRGSVSHLSWHGIYCCYFTPGKSLASLKLPLITTPACE